jgi:hypothetical protein
MMPARCVARPSSPSDHFEREPKPRAVAFERMIINDDPNCGSLLLYLDFLPRRPRGLHLGPSKMKGASAAGAPPPPLRTLIAAEGR